MQRKLCPIAWQANGFCYQASEFCSKIAWWASDSFFGVFKLKKNCSQFLPEVQALKMILFALWRQRVS